MPRVAKRVASASAPVRKIVIVVLPRLAGSSRGSAIFIVKFNSLRTLAIFLGSSNGNCGRCGRPAVHYSAARDRGDKSGSIYFRPTIKSKCERGGGRALLLPCFPESACVTRSSGITWELIDHHTFPCSQRSPTREVFQWSRSDPGSKPRGTGALSRPGSRNCPRREDPTLSERQTGPAPMA